MIKSMTAYARAEYRQGDTVYIAEIRSLNHRYLDIVPRFPKNLLVFEKDLKTLIASKVRRGRLEVFIEIQHQGGEAPYALELNKALVESYADVYNQLAELVGSDQPLPPESLWQIKDVIIAKPQQIDTPTVWEGLKACMSQAIEALDEMKTREGRAINADFFDRIALIERHVEEIAQSAPGLVDAYQKKLEDNIERMLKNVAVDEVRVAQEVVLFAEKSDITEEIVRLRSHIVQFHEFLSLNDMVGRKLDFLIQEFNREINTIGSKAADAAVSRVVVQMKAELEKIREQVQNVE